MHPSSNMQVQQPDYTNANYTNAAFRYPPILRQGTQLKTAPLMASILIVALALCFVGAFVVVLANRRVRKVDRPTHKLEAGLQLKEMGFEDQQPPSGRGVFGHGTNWNTPFKTVRGVFEKTAVRGGVSL
ncbi:hypothetical protein AK830_g8258 [Neonectria ditissima]|uniref:Uncharacterized protein n=1 Tax=Neonectria ditissima TaxID=78410 RepID=A0A0P7BCS9_9HYPO|nr:hypothetical protein AK830_g8258 [Neonectria ditissima]